MPIAAKASFGRMALLSFCPTRPLAVTLCPGDMTLRVYATRPDPSSREPAGAGAQPRNRWRLVGSLALDRQVHHVDWDPSGWLLVGYWHRHHWRQTADGS
eukprot:3562603-Rhodomonas_salina.3